MSINRASLLASGIGLIVSTVASSSSALSQVIGGNDAFRPYPTHGVQQCFYELYGGAWNSCTQQPTVIFELPLDESGASGGPYDVYTYGLNNGGSGSFTCQAVAVSNNSFTGYWGNNATITGNVGQSGWSFVEVPAGYNLRLQCNYVPLGRGVQAIHYGKS